MPRFSRRTCKREPDYTPPMSEQKENLRKAEASLQDAEKRLAMVRKWQPRMKQAVLEFHASVQRLKDLAAGDVPRAVNLLTRMIDALEAYLRVAPPPGLGIETAAAAVTTATLASPQLVAIATKLLDEDDSATKAEAQDRAHGKDDAESTAQAPNSDVGPSGSPASRTHEGDPAVAVPGTLPE